MPSTGGDGHYMRFGPPSNHIRVAVTNGRPTKADYFDQRRMRR